MTARLILIGAGHAHMEALRQADRFQAAGLAVTLIDPGVFWYSGAATGMLSGALSMDHARADPAAVHAGVEIIKARAEHIDAKARTITLDDGRRLSFDVASLNTGSRIAPSALTETGAIPVKPVSNLADVRRTVEQADGRLRLAVAGGGATGVEVALSLASLQRRLSAPVQVMLAAPAPLLSGWPDRASRLAESALAEAGIGWRRARAERIEAGDLVLADGGREAVDQVIAATGLVAQLPRGLDQGPDGLAVGPDLSWLGDPGIFAAGDCAHITHAPRPKLGVFGVRAAPVLIDNLIAAGAGRTDRRRYDPQARWLSLMDLGDGSALGRYGVLAHRSRFALALKRWIDGRFVQRYQGVHD